MRRFISSPIVLWLLVALPDSNAQMRVLTHREQATLQRSWIENRFSSLLPSLMREAGLDMWIVVSREYNDDPVFRSMAPVTTYSSRRRTILVFADRGTDRGVERLSIGRFDYDGLFTVVPTHNDGQWEGLRKVVEERDPASIGVDISEHFSHADGLTANERDNLIKAIGPKYQARVRPAEKLVVAWLEAKLPEETDAYRSAVQLAHEIIAEAFSSRVIVPGVTTTLDVAWWMRQRVADLGLAGWFHPTVSAFRQGDSGAESSRSGRVIRRGDLLHCDFGLVYLGFSTDTQRMAYVLLPGEADAPQGLKDGLKAANRLQDLTMQYAAVGGTGNAALAEALRQARKEGITPSIYCHPVGYHGHGAGPPIGMTDYQNGVPYSGEYSFRAGSWHAIELNAANKVPEWNDQQVRFPLEDDAVITDKGWQWIDGRQTSLYLIR